MTIERRDVGRQLVDQGPAASHGEGTDDADRREPAVALVDAEHQGAHRVGRRRVRPVTGDDAVGGALVLDLGHHPLVGLVGLVPVLGDHSVQPGPLELVEPAGRDRSVIGDRGQVHRWHRVGEGRFQAMAALGERAVTQVLVTETEEVEGHEAGRGLRGQRLHPARGRVQPQLEELEVEGAAGRVDQDDLAVDDATWGQLGADGLDDLREVARQRPFVAAADLDFVTVAEHDGAEPVPLRLVEHPGRDLARQPGQHRLDRRHDGQLHRWAQPR